LSIKYVLKVLTFILLCGCNKFMMPAEPDSDFKLNCLRWKSNITVCEGYIDTDNISGYLKIWAYRDDPYYGTSLSLCGGDLSVQTGNVLHNFAIESETENNLICLDADENDIEWDWESDNELNIAWEDIVFDIEISDCPYEDSHCGLRGYGYTI